MVNKLTFEVEACIRQTPLSLPEGGNDAVTPDDDDDNDNTQ